MYAVVISLQAAKEEHMCTVRAVTRVINVGKVLSMLAGLSAANQNEIWACNVHANGITTTPKRQILLFVFTFMSSEISFNMSLFQSQHYFQLIHQKNNTKTSCNKLVTMYMYLQWLPAIICTCKGPIAFLPSCSCGANLIDCICRTKFIQRLI